MRLWYKACGDFLISKERSGDRYVSSDLYRPTDVYYFFGITSDTGDLSDLIIYLLQHKQYAIAAGESDL